MFRHGGTSLSLFKSGGGVKLGDVDDETGFRCYRIWNKIGQIRLVYSAHCVARQRKNSYGTLLKISFSTSCQLADQFGLKSEQVEDNAATVGSRRVRDQATMVLQMRFKFWIMVQPPKSAAGK
jgi:hypothetical protein